MKVGTISIDLCGGQPPSALRVISTRLATVQAASSKEAMFCPFGHDQIRVVKVRIEAPQFRVRSFRFALPVTRTENHRKSPSSHDQVSSTDDLLGFGAGSFFHSTATNVGLYGVPYTLGDKHSGRINGNGPCLSEGRIRRTTSRQHIRLRPPDDTVRLSDRLFYVLQPPVEQLVKQLSFPADPFHYQLEGIAFLYSRHAAILADEMGLGKTMQAITAVRLLRHHGQLRQALLVCPKALVENWRAELSRWAPELPVMVINGNPRERLYCWQSSKAVVKIANYELLVRDAELLERITINGRRLFFDLVILDEAQRIKNRTSRTHKVVCQLPRQRSWALTGTPVENSAEDLVGIFEFLSPGLLSSADSSARMVQVASHYILRRTKEQVLNELPPKIYRDAYVHLTPQQEQSYYRAEHEGVLELGQLEDALTIQHVFELITRLKQICNFDPATGASAKLERLEADLEEVAASGRKAVVFSQWVWTLEKLKQHLARFQPAEYHGRISTNQREEQLRRFREDPNCHVLLISYGAGGVGLNLQFAGYVFLFDRWWNPAVEDQAINRLHRIGAAGPVTVTRFLTRGTIEERIDQILRRKRQLFDSLVTAAAQRGRFSLSQEELFSLFGLEIASRCARAA